MQQIEKYKTSDKLFETAITPNEHTTKRYNAGLCIFRYPFHYFSITCACPLSIYAPEDCWWPEIVPLTGEILQLVLRGCLASNRNSVITTTNTRDNMDNGEQSQWRLKIEYKIYINIKWSLSCLVSYSCLKLSFLCFHSLSLFESFNHNHINLISTNHVWARKCHFWRYPSPHKIRF